MIWANQEFQVGGECPFCKNGTISEGWNYLSHQCPDCNGKGYFSEEDNGEDHPLRTEGNENE